MFHVVVHYSEIYKQLLNIPAVQQRNLNILFENITQNCEFNSTGHTTYALNINKSVYTASFLADSSVCRTQSREQFFNVINMKKKIYIPKFIKNPTIEVFLSSSVCIQVRLRLNYININQRCEFSSTKEYKNAQHLRADKLTRLNRFEFKFRKIKHYIHRFTEYTSTYQIP